MSPTTCLRRAGVACATLAASALLAVAADRRLALVLESDDPVTRRATVAAVERAGGRVVHAFDGLLVVEASPAATARLARLRGLRGTSETALPASRARGRSDAFRVGLEAWNRVLRAGAPGLPGGDAPIPDDPFGGEHAFVPPAAGPGVVAAAVATAARTRDGSGMLLDRAVASATEAPWGLPYGAYPENTSEYLAGSVSVNVVLMESDGTIDLQSENWAADREAAVASNVAAALDWLAAREPQARLSFTYHVYAGRTDARARTGYEPIRRSADPNGSTGEALWLTQILGKLGYTSGDRFVRSRAFAHATRQTDGTDWGLNVFVADSMTDADGRFADGYFAYTWVGGPHVVVTYDNSTWGVSRMHMVLRHEMLHAFYAFDEYQTSGCACTASRGYLNGPGTNCTACNAYADPCVMIANGDAMCDATRRQIGWADLEGDGVADVVGQDPDTFADPAPDVACGPTEVTGTATVVAATNLNPMSVTPRASISVARLAGVEVQDGGGAWMQAVPADGAWDEPVEAFRATIDPGPGPREVALRALDDYGNADASPAAISIAVYPVASPLAGAILVARQGAAIELRWEATSGAAAYRVYAAPAPAGPWTALGDTSWPTWVDDPTASAFYRVRTIDACGNEEP